MTEAQALHTPVPPKENVSPFDGNAEVFALPNGTLQVGELRLARPTVAAEAVVSFVGGTVLSGFKTKPALV